MTRAHQGGTNRGYVYAYACDTAGNPISFNFLIGNEIVFDGIDALDYGMNAFSWRAIPPTRQLTDLDSDGIRDLNSYEYEPSPDVILIPRFLGQTAAFARTDAVRQPDGRRAVHDDGGPADLQRQRGSVLGAVHVPLLGQGAAARVERYLLELDAARIAERSE